MSSDPCPNLSALLEEKGKKIMDLAANIDAERAELATLLTDLQTSTDFPSRPCEEWCPGETCGAMDGLSTSKDDERCVKCNMTKSDFEAESKETDPVWAKYIEKFQFKKTFNYVEPMPLCLDCVKHCIQCIWCDRWLAYKGKAIDLHGILAFENHFVCKCKDAKKHRAMKKREASATTASAKGKVCKKSKSNEKLSRLAFNLASLSSTDV